MTVLEFMKEQARGWYKHYKNSVNFKKTLQSHKVDALLKYFSKSKCHGFKATRVSVKAMLMEIIEEEEKGDVEGGLGGEEDDKNMQEDVSQIGEEGVGLDNLDFNVALEEETHILEEKDTVVEGELEQEENKQTGESTRQYITKCEYLNMTDQELFSQENIPEFVTKTFNYKEREKIWNEKEATDFIGDKTTVELFQKLCNTPQKIKETKTFKKKISALSNKDKSSSLIAESVDEVIEALKKHPSEKNKELVKVISAAVTSSK